jgi:hypothetical protein
MNFREPLDPEKVLFNPTLIEIMNSAPPDAG